MFLNSNEAMTMSVSVNLEDPIPRDSTEKCLILRFFGGRPTVHINGEGTEGVSEGGLYSPVYLYLLGSLPRPPLSPLWPSPAALRFLASCWLLRSCL